MDEHVDFRLASHLEADERLLWSGRPSQGVRMQVTDAFLVPFSLLWGGFAFFWEYMVIRQGAPWFFVIWGIPFVLVGAHLIVGRFFWDAKRRSATHYAVTDRRIIVSSGLWRPQTRSVNLRTLSDLSMTERANGSGDIVLGSAPPMMSRFASSGWPGMNWYMPPVLEGIPGVREVYGIIRQGQTRAV